MAFADFKTALYTDKDVRKGFFQVAIAVFRCRDPKMERMSRRPVHRGCRKKEKALRLGKRSVGHYLRDWQTGNILHREVPDIFRHRYIRQTGRFR